MSLSRDASGIEMNPIYVVATQTEVWSLSTDDYICGVPLAQLVQALGPSQHVYLVHLETTTSTGEVKLTQLY